MFRLLTVLLIVAPPPPKLVVARPLTVEPGAKTVVTVRGQNLDKLLAVQMHEPKSRARLIGPAKKVPVPNGQTADKAGDWEVEIEVDLAADAPTGRAAVAVVGPGGPSTAAALVVSDGTPRIPEQRDQHRGFTTAQPVSCPSVVDGVVSGDNQVDLYRFPAAAGDRVRLRIEAARLGSVLDAVLTVYDAERNVLTTCDDFAGSPDPEITLTLPKAGTYFASVIDAHGSGGPAHVYRLVLTK